MRMRRRATASRVRMRHVAVAGGLAGAALLTALAAGAQERGARETVVTLSSREAALAVELADGGTRTVSLADGRILVDGATAGSYESGGALERAWRELLREPRTLDAGTPLDVLRGWDPPDGEGRSALLAAIASLAPAAPEEERTVSRPLDGLGAVAIAPGLRSMEELTRGIERLRRSLTRIGSQARVAEDDVALVVHDDFAVPADRVVNGDLVLLGGELDLQGDVRGNVLVLEGSLTLGESARVAGDVVQVGGQVHREGGRVAGEIVSLSLGDDFGPEDLDVRDGASAGDAATNRSGEIRGGRSSGRRGPAAAFARNVGRTFGGLGAVLGWYIGLGLLGLGLVYFFRPRLETVADTARLDVTRCFGVGLAGQLLALPVLLVLVVGIVTWLVIPFYVVGVLLALPAGYIAAAHAAGETLALRRYDWVERLRLRRSNSYWYVGSGLAVLLAPFAVASLLYLFGGVLGFLRGLAFFAGGVLTWTAVSVGLGAMLLSRAGSRSPSVAEGGADPFGGTASTGAGSAGV